MKLKTFTILFVFLIIFVIVLADRDQLGFLGIIYEIPYADKVGHFVLFGALSFLINLALLRSFLARTPKRLLLATTLILALVIGIEEWSQKFFPNRTPDWRDLLASYLGIALGAYLAWKRRE